jgi:hypothetical protein
LQQVYFDLHFIHKSIEIVEQNKILLRQFEKTAKARYSVGQAVQQDVFLAQLEISACWTAWLCWINRRKACTPRSTAC